ncbi:hypothetical protein TTHERM_00460590 (macronuclear) [Tetrahymena thermophila SB210]|uniref:Uncharacterized protein n=1 Tax=Tetrahymena thermophila (strain SB210) TaxID=312017 RepID=Q23Q25_TETTS|nr:hypothetical protein TTHERM_00460590 [Tetrahymena thermophila SB210]EAR98510.2 hypothetical protein TTHERM_00460590 [Tetrahymena thermophila SB210]|eukprot:XP_001018755.2 hypothetical protein TTHERM_00460590 [Tetrahymena thermophila SB210]
MGNFISGQRKQQAIQESISEQEIQKYSHIKAIAINSPQNFTLDDAKYNCIETINFHLAFRNLNDEEIIHISNLLYILPQTLRVANFMLQSNKVSEKGWSCFFSNIKYLSSLSQLSLSLNNSDSLNIKPSNFKTLGKSLPKSLTLIYLNLNTIQISLKCIEELLKEATQKPNLNSVRLLANQLIEDYNGYFFEKFHTWFSKSNVSVIDFYLSFQTINDYDVATSFEQFFANIPNHLQMIKLQIRINLTATAYLSITQIINKLMKKINGKKLEILQLEILSKQQNNFEFKNQIACINNILLALNTSNLSYFQLFSQFGSFTCKNSELQISNISHIELQKGDIFETALSTRLSFHYENIPELHYLLNKQKIIQMLQIAIYSKLVQPTLFSYSKSFQMKYNCWDLHF